MRAYALRTFCLFAVLSAPATSQAIAQEADEAAASSDSGSSVDVTPYVSIGSLGSSRVGSAVTFSVARNLEIEAELGYRNGEGDLHFVSSSVSVLFNLPQIGQVTPYVAAGAGLEEYGTPIVLPGASGILTQSKLTLAINAGGGLKVPVSDAWAFRTDARWFKPFGRRATEHWRVYQGGSLSVGSR